MTCFNEYASKERVSAEIAGCLVKRIMHAEKAISSIFMDTTLINLFCTHTEPPHIHMSQRFNDNEKKGSIWKA